MEERVAPRDPEAFRRFVEAYSGRVFRLVASILGPWRDVDAEDVVQEVFLRAWQRLDQFRGESSIGTWLYRIAWTQALNRKRAARIRLPHVPLESLAETASGAEEMNSVLARREVAAAVEELPDLYRTVLLLHYWAGCGVAEIGELLQAPEGTVKSYLARGRERLRAALGKGGAARHD
ncbi:MAG TPA: RNA polymerase sigma factor [Thermoanaerobaculia bacterium]|nr:RNA polymerase sigma factor [Thermoanaerobaculia bacterium]